jgi:hypothetical protein
MDYACEQGASRNFEPWRERDEVVVLVICSHAQGQRKRGKAEGRGGRRKSNEGARKPDFTTEERNGFAIECLDKIVDLMDAIDEIKAKKSKLSQYDSEQLLEMYRQVTVMSC